MRFAHGSHFENLLTHKQNIIMIQYIEGFRSYVHEICAWKSLWKLVDTHEQNIIMIQYIEEFRSYVHEICAWKSFWKLVDTHEQNIIMIQYIQGFRSYVHEICAWKSLWKLVDTQTEYNHDPINRRIQIIHARDLCIVILKIHVDRKETKCDLELHYNLFITLLLGSIA